MVLHAVSRPRLYRAPVSAVRQSRATGRDRDALLLGAVKYGFKVVIVVVNTVFLYWAKSAFRQHHPQTADAATTTRIHQNHLEGVAER